MYSLISNNYKTKLEYSLMSTESITYILKNKLQDLLAFQLVIKEKKCIPCKITTF